MVDVHNTDALPNPFAILLLKVELEGKLDFCDFFMDQYRSFDIVRY